MVEARKPAEEYVLELKKEGSDKIAVSSLFQFELTDKLIKAEGSDSDHKQFTIEGKVAFNALSINLIYPKEDILNKYLFGDLDPLKSKVTG